MKRIDVAHEHDSQHAAVPASHLHHAFDRDSDALVYVTDREGRCLFVGPHGLEASNIPFRESVGQDFGRMFGPDYAQKAHAQDKRILSTGQSETEEYSATVNESRRIFSVTKSAYRDGDGSVAGIYGIARDVTIQRRTEQALQQQIELLESLARGASMEEILNRIISSIEQEIPEAYCCFMLVDQEGKRLRVGAPGRVPRTLIDALDGSGIAPETRPCAAVVKRGNRLAVEDIAGLKKWNDFKALALSHRFNSCFSFPIRSRSSSSTAVVGTCEVYFREPTKQTALLTELIDRFECSAAIAIANHRDLETRPVRISPKHEFESNTPATESSDVNRLHTQAFATQTSRESSLQLSSIFETVEDMLFVLAVESEGHYRFQSINPAFTKTTGWKEEDVVGKRLEEVNAGRSLIELLPYCHRAFTTHQLVRWEQTAVYPAGTRFGDVSVSPVMGDDGKCNFLVGSVHDITARKHAEISLQAHQERYRSLIAAIAEGVVLCDSNGSVLTCNNSAERILGLTADQICGRENLNPEWYLIQEDGSPFSPLDHPSTITLQTGKAMSGVVMGVHKPDGTLSWIEVSSEPVTYSGALTPNAVVCSFSDITASKLAESKLRESERHLAEAQRIARIGSWSWEPSTGKVWWSKAIYELFGLDSVMVPPSFEAFLSCVHPDDRATTIQRVDAMMAGDNEFANDIRMVRPSGEIIWIHSRARATRDSSGNIVSVEGTDQDITERKLAENALHESEQRLKLALKAGSAIAFEWDIQSDRVKRYYSIEPALPTNSQSPDRLADVRARVHPNDIAAFDANLNACLELGTEYRNVYRLQRPDGSTIWLEEWGILEHTADGKPKTLTGISIDVTERTKAEAELQKTTKLLTAVANGTSDIVFVKNAAGQYLLYNEAGAHFVGQPLPEIIGKDDAMLFDEATANRIRESDLCVMASGASEIYEETIASTKEVRVFLTTKAPYRDEAGKVIGVMGIARDISDRKAAERILKLTQCGIHHAMDSIFWISPEGQFIHVNEAACRRLGYTHEEMTKITVSDIDPTCSPEKAHEFWERLKSEGSIIMESKHWTKDGRSIDVEITSNFCDYEGQQYNCAIARDITDRNLLEEQLRQSQKLEAVGRLAGGVAHDFNNLLLVINCHTDLLLMDSNEHDPRNESYLAIQDASNRAAELTSQLLVFSRKSFVETKSVDLNEVVESVSRLLSRVIREDIAVNFALEPSLFRIKADPGQISQVIMNLVMNAIDAMPSGGQLAIATENLVIENNNRTNHPKTPEGQYVSLEVTDTGHGMSEETRSKIFEPFFTTKEVGKGTGLGLSVVHGVVMHCKGHINVTSSVDGGTTFQLLFPSTEEQGEAPRSQNAKMAKRYHETILVVEDEVAVRRVIRTILESHGFKVLLASNGANALQAMDQCGEPIHLVITDFVMPEMGGKILAEAIRQRTPELKILYMSGHTDETVNDLQHVTDGNSFLRKPFNSVDLVRKIRALLDAS